MKDFHIYFFQNSEKKIQNRWELIEATLLGPMRNSVELQVNDTVKRLRTVKKKKRFIGELCQGQVKLERLLQLFTVIIYILIVITKLHY